MQLILLSNEMCNYSDTVKYSITLFTSLTS